MEGWNGKGAHEVPAVTFKSRGFARALLIIFAWGLGNIQKLIVIHGDLEILRRITYLTGMNITKS